MKVIYDFPVRLGQKVYVWGRTVNSKLPKIIAGEVVGFRINKKGQYVKISVCTDWGYIDGLTAEGEHSTYNRYFSYPITAFRETFFDLWEDADDALARFEAGERMREIANNIAGKRREKYDAD